jgi:hypothetical protein
MVPNNNIVLNVIVVLNVAVPNVAKNAVPNVAVPNVFVLNVIAVLNDIALTPFLKYPEFGCLVFKSPLYSKDLNTGHKLYGQGHLKKPVKKVFNFFFY